MQNVKTPFRNIQLAAILALVLLCSFVWYRALTGFRVRELTVSFLDVGQGDAILIEAANGNKVLIDGGNTNGAVLRELGEVLPFYDRNIDLVITTHPDQDHIGGLPEVFSRYSVGALMEPGLYAGNGVYEETEKAAEKRGAKKILARSGEKIHLDKNAVLEILYPERNTAPGAEPNTASIVVRLTYGKESFLFTGDLPQNQEEALVQKYGSSLRSNVLKFGHHGSKTSTSPIFLANVHPEYGIISVGADNKYGHPNKETLDLAAAGKVNILRTDTQGTITFKTDGLVLSYSADK